MYLLFTKLAFHFFQVLYPNGTLHIPYARRASDQGVYQCVAANSVGQAAAPPALARILSDAESNDEDEDDDLWNRPELLDHLATVPPSRPNVSQSGADSAMIVWDVPNTSLTGEMMPIQVS